MRSTIAVGVRACGVALFLLLATASGAEQTSSVIGSTRQQVLQRYGDPRSVIAAGGREIFFYARQRIILRDGVVVDVESIAAEPAHRPAPAPAPVTPAPGAPSTGSAAAPETTAPASAPAKSEPATKAAPTPAPAAAAETTAEPARPAEPAATTAEPAVLIKRIQPPTGGYVRPPSAPKDTAPKATPPPEPVVEPAAPVAAPTPRPPETDPRATMPAREEPPSATSAPVSSPPPAAESAATAPMAAEPAVTSADAVAAATSEEPAKPPVPDKKAGVRKKRAVTTDVVLETPPPIFTPRTYVIGLLAAGAAAYLIWRWRQRQLELVATAVSRTPFLSAAVASAENGERFTASMLSKLEQKRFEELVAAYYGKTGVVATRTEAGPSSPVQIKISWKGESRPFALVQCIARPQELVDVKPIQELFAVLNTEDIRRGYVVTCGKFNVAARDFAEEKHLTLLSGDLLLEKLNALPDSARAELMQQIAAGDAAPAA